MDRPRREVLRRKRPIIADLLDFSAASQKEYKHLGLLLDEMLPEIRVERSEFGRVFKWLELLPMRGPDAFDQLASLLKLRGHSWLANEMFADLDYEKGTIHIEEYVFRESGMLVHKLWGKSRRISEVEKKEIQRLISGRYQTAKEGYKRQIEEIQRQLEDVSSTKWSENGKMKDLVMKIHAYLRVEHDRLDGAVLELQEALGLVQSLLEERSKGKTKEILDNEYQEVFGHALDGILELLSKVLYEREETTKERKKCIDIICEELEIEKERPVFHIDAMIEEIIARYRNLVEQTQKELDVSNTLAKSAEERLYEIKEETDKSLSEKEEQIIKLESEILEKTAEVGEMKKSELSLVEEKDGWRDEAEKWRRRTEQIERTRRIGYYPGAYDSIYYDDSSYALKRKPNARWHKMDHELHGGHGNNVHRGSSLDSYSYRMMLDDYDETTRRIYLAKRKDQKRNVTKKQMTVANNKKEKKLPPESLASNDLGSLSLTPPLEDGKYLVEMGANDQQTVPYSKARNNKRDISVWR